MDLIIFTMAAVVMGSIIWLVVPIVLGLVVSAFLLVFWSIKFLIELAFGSDDNGQ